MKKICKKCNGLGWIPNPSSPNDFNPLECPSCSGSGVIAKVDTSTGEEAPSQTNQNNSQQQRPK